MNQTNKLKEQYPEIAKKTVEEIVLSGTFTVELSEVLAEIKKQYSVFPDRKRTSYDAAKDAGVLDNRQIFKQEFIKCLDKESKLNANIRKVIMAIGIEAYNRTLKIMFKKYEET